MTHELAVSAQGELDNYKGENRLIFGNWDNVIDC